MHPLILTLRFRPASQLDCLDVFVSAPWRDERKVGETTRGILTGLRGTLREQLEQAKSYLGGEDDLRGKFRRVQEVVEQLRVIGRTLAYDTLGGTDAALTVQQLLGETWPFWRQYEGQAPVVQVDSEYLLPYELWPAFGASTTYRPPRIVDDATLVENLRQFLGFSSVVRRHIRGTPVLSPDIVDERLGAWALDNSRGLMVTVFQHASTESAKAQVELSRRWRRVLVSGPAWPVDGSSATPRVFAEHLFTSRLAKGKRQERAAHVLHFACHCDTTGAGENLYELLLQAAMTQEQLHIQLDFLKAASFDFPDEEPGLRPLVFLNACGTSAVDPATSGSFPRFFLAHRFLGVIGTETAIPDKVAATFSEFFYKALLTGSTLGQSLVNAKAAVVHALANPLGLLYSAYVNPDIVVTKRASERSLV